MENQDLLTFTDALKLVIPFLLALILIWSKRYYENYRERKNKNLHLWKGLKQEFGNCTKGIEALNKILESLIIGEIKFFALDIPSTLTNYSNRLAELEINKSYLYSDYASWVEIIRKGHISLQAIQSQAAFQNLDDTNTGPRIKKAIESQAKALKKDFILLAESELKLMKHIQIKYQKNGEQEINKMEQHIEDARSKI